MMDSNTLLIVMAALFVVSIIIILLIVLNNSKRTNDLHNELSRSIYEIRSQLNKDIADLNLSINGEFSDISERINSNIIQTHKASNEVFNTINEKMVRIDEAQRGLSELSKDVLSLQDILTDKKSRGSFGEVELYSLLEAAYGNNSELYARQYKLSNNAIADAVIFSKTALGILCIDSKFPLENYRNMLDIRLDQKSRELYRRKFRDDVRKHIDDISRKYIIPGETADLAYMFVPAEAVFAEIYASFSELIDLSYRKKVYIVSPTTLMAYITAIKSIYLGVKKDEKAREISQLLNELSVEFKRYEKRNEELYKTYEDLGKSFYELKTTSDKIIKRFDRIDSGEFADNEKGC